MKQQNSNLESFQIMGIKTRTTNTDEMKGSGKIPALWGRFYAEALLSKIPNKLDHEILAVYHDYETDATGAYSLLIGVKVPKGSPPPAGFETLEIPAQKYVQFTTCKGAMPGIVIEAWQYIWMQTQESQLPRTYTYDLEVYGASAADPSSAQVDVFIAVK